MAVKQISTMRLFLKKIQTQFRVDCDLMVCCRRADEMPIGTECRAANGSVRATRGSQPAYSEKVN